MRFITNHRNIITEVIACLFIGLFMYAAMSKIIDFAEFKAQLGLSPILTPFSRTLAWVIPALEILLSLLLSLTRTRYLALAGSFGLMVLFSMYIFAITHFSDHVPCSCGGILQQMSWGQHLVFNLVFAAIGLTGILLSDQEHKLLLQ